MLADNLQIGARIEHVTIAARLRLGECNAAVIRSKKSHPITGRLECGQTLLLSEKQRRE
jgi:hypothetical protein